MPSGQGYSYKNWGTNREGNHYCTRDYGPDVVNPNAYHYSNQDGSYYYSNPNGSTYYNDGKGYSIYTPLASPSSSSSCGSGWDSGSWSTKN